MDKSFNLGILYYIVFTKLELVECKFSFRSEVNLLGLLH